MTLSKFVDLIMSKAKYYLYAVGILFVIYYTLNFHQEKYCNFIDGLSTRIFGHADVLFLLDDIFYNLVFFAILALLITLICRIIGSVWYDVTDITIHSYPTISICRTLYAFLRITSICYFGTHILLYYKLSLGNFLLSLFTIKISDEAVPVFCTVVILFFVSILIFIVYHAIINYITKHRSE